MFFKRQDHRISIIGGLLLMALTLVAGISVYIVMQRQAESVLSKSLQASLQSNVRLFESQIEHVLINARTVATRPYLIQNLKLLESTPDHPTAAVEMQRAAQSFLLTGFTGMFFYDAQGREVASAGTFLHKYDLRVPLKTKNHTFLLWDGQFSLHVTQDIFDEQGRRVGALMVQASLPLLTRVFNDAAANGKTDEFAMCAPVENDEKNMHCFLAAVSGKQFKHVARVIEGKPLPMNYALRGETGIIFAKDYRREQVIAAYAPISSLGLGLVMKIDQAELYQPVTSQLKFIAPLLLALVLLGMLLLNYLVTPLVRKLVHSEQEARDVSTRLYNSEAQLRLITDAVPAMIAYVDVEQRFRFHNRAYEKSFGLSSMQMENKTMREVMGEELYEIVRPRVEQVLAGYPVDYERTQKTTSGELRDYATHYFPRFGGGQDGDKNGQVIGFYALSSDITELKRIDRMKNEFVSTVSHELRTPLTSIRGSLGLISGGVAGELPKAIKSLVEIAKNNCERLIRLINDILDIEKIEAGKIKLNLQIVELKPLMVQTLAVNEGFGVARNVSLHLHFPDDSLKIHADSDRLTQVITNLLSNAMKFSPADGVVEVHVSRAGLGVRVEVRDQGPGIPHEFHSRIFQKFSQADSSDARQKGGTGLGLSISRAIVELLGGRIGFDSQTDVGTTFFFELPEWKS